MNLSKAKREAIKQRYGGFCSYCGTQLWDRWHVDHMASVGRISELVKGPRGQYLYRPTGELTRPENDHEGNLAPACIPCNIHKADLPLEHWRRILEGSAETLEKNYSTYRHALRFGLIKPTVPKVIFHFERWPPRRRPVTS